MCELEENNLVVNVEKEYLLDYYDKVGSAYEGENLLISLLRDRVKKQREERFESRGG